MINIELNFYGTYDVFLDGSYIGTVKALKNWADVFAVWEIEEV